MLNVLRLLKPRWKRDAETIDSFGGEDEFGDALLDDAVDADEAGEFDGDAEELAHEPEVELVSPGVIEPDNRPSHALIERFAMVCFLEEIDYSTMPLDEVSFAIFRGCLERLQGMTRVEACVLCWEALAKVGDE